MKSKAFWVRRFVFVSALAFVILVGADLLKGGRIDAAVPSALAWALISASIFTAARYRSARKGLACALCRDTAD
ncbi:MAG: hypothetical protein V4582_14190 [Pseudomonadota bacterium]